MKSVLQTCVPREELLNETFTPMQNFSSGSNISDARFENHT